MRMTLAAAGVVLATAASAHDDGHPIAGEQPVEKESVSDAVWDILIPEAEAAATITVKGAYRYISANGYPNKAPGKFPNAGNPHRISKKNYQLKVPANPKKTGRVKDTGRNPFGIALNGVLFDPRTAETWQNNRRSGWNYEALGGACKLGLDRYNAHVQPDGTYHYHSIPTGVVAASGGRSAPALIGYAADGFPIYGPYGYSDPSKKSGMKKLKSSYVIKSGTRPSGPGGRYNGKFTQDYAYVAGRGDLDQCNGRFAVTPEFPQGTYQYVVTDSFPYIPRCWMGSPDGSFMKLKGRPGGQRRSEVQEQDLPVVQVQAEGRPPRFHLFGQRPPPPQGQGRRQGGPRRQGGRGPCSGS